MRVYEADVSETTIRLKLKLILDKAKEVCKERHQVEGVIRWT